MKLFLITILILWSLILSAQTTGITIYETLLTNNLSGSHPGLENYNSFSLKQGTQLEINTCISEPKEVHISSGNTNLHIQQSIAIDSSIQRFSKYQSWYKISLVEFGINYNTANTSASKNNNLKYGQAVLNYSMGFQSL